MKNKANKSNPLSDDKEDKVKKGPAGYPLYPAKDDIYNQSKELENVNPEDTSGRKSKNEKGGSLNEKDFSDDVSGGDLDVPGSELDDDPENIGSEDEENSYFSLGGDDHEDLEDDKA
jgi:hypothetical protein